jgi:hypothetical protein
MPPVAVTQVECVNGCGGGVDPVALIALVVALAALGMAWREHREFLRRLKARAKLELTLRVVQPADATAEGLIEIDGNAGTFVVEIGLKNTGDKAAGPAIINLLAPEYVELRWSGPRGEDLGQEAKQRLYAAETFEVAGRAAPVPARYLWKETPRISLRGARVAYASFYVSLGSSEEFRAPLRATASCDELPDNVDEVSASLPVRIRQRSAAR